MLDTTRLHFLPRFDHFTRQYVNVETLFLSTKTKSIAAVRNFRKLSSLHMSYARHISDISSLVLCPNLTSLDLSWCTNLKCIWSTLRQLKLVSLDLTNVNIVGQDDDFGTDDAMLPTTLETLSLRNCLLPTVNVLQGLNLLRCLDLSLNTSLRSVEELQFLPKLETLSLFQCVSLRSLQVLSSLLELEQLNVSGCYKLRGTLPSSPKLKTLYMNYCDKLETLDNLSSAVETLYMNHCKRVPRLNRLATMKNLQHLSMQGCVSVRHLAPLANCLQLKYVDARLCRNLTDTLTHVQTFKAPDELE